MFLALDTPQKRLESYLKDHELSYRAAAKLFGCSAASLCKYVGGQRWPAVKYAVKIQKYTGIPVAEWIRDEDED